jgi:hypothetical protein
MSFLDFPEEDRCLLWFNGLRSDSDFSFWALNIPTLKCIYSKCQAVRPQNCESRSESFDNPFTKMVWRQIEIAKRDEEGKLRTTTM